MRARLAFCLMSVLAVLLGCSGGGSSSPPPQVATVTISPHPGPLLVGESRRFSAEALTASGDPVTGVTTTWSLSDPSKGTVSPNGRFTAIATGSEKVIATVDEAADTVPVTILHAGPDAILVDPSGDTLAVGFPVSLTAVVLDARLDTMPAAALTYLSSAPSVVTVNASGTVSPVGTGTAGITVTSGQATTTVPMLVLQCGTLVTVNTNNFSLPVRAGGTKPSGTLSASGRYKTTGVLYGAGVIVGTSAQLTVVGYDPDNQSSGFAQGAVCNLTGPSASHTWSRLTVGPGALGPTRLRIIEETYSDVPAGVRDYILFRYTIVNTGSVPVAGLRLGFAADWDAGFDLLSFEDVAQVSANASAVEVLEADSVSHPQMLGLASFGSGGAAAFAWLNGTLMTPATFYNQIGTTPAAAAKLQGDVRALTGRGTYTVAPGERIRVYFALAGGDTRSAYETSLGWAQQAAAALGP